MQNSVFSRQLVESIVDELKITDLAQATIGQVVLLASALEQRTGIPFIRMDQGVPGLSPNQVGIAAEKRRSTPVSQPSTRPPKAFRSSNAKPRAS